MTTMETTPQQAENTAAADSHAFYLFRILQSLRQSIRAIDLHSRRLAESYNITSPQLICLLEIEQSQPVTVTALARQVHLSPSTVVGIVDRLVDKGFVTRDRSTSDRRKVEIRMTTQGKALVDKAPSPLQETLAEQFKALSEEDQLNIVQSLERVVDMMGATNIDAAPMLETGPIDYSPDDKQAFWEAAEAPINALVVDEPQEFPLEIKRATEADKPHVMSFINSSTEWYRSIIDEKDLSEHQVSPEWAETNFKRREFYVGWSEGKPVGTVSLQFFGDYTYLGYVYVDTDQVGKGFGKKLLQFAAEESKRRGMKGMALIAHPRATWAIKAYQKFGFRLELRDKEDVLSWNDGCLEPYYEEFFMLFLYEFE